MRKGCYLGSVAIVFGLCVRLSMCQDLGSAYVKNAMLTEEENTDCNTSQDFQTGIYLKESVLSPDQLSSDIESLYLDMTPAVTLAVATVSTWFGSNRC